MATTFELVLKPRKGWQPVNWGEIWLNRQLLGYLVWRDIKIRYRQTFLGGLWAVLQPLLAMLIFTLFFHRLAGVSSDGPPYPLFAFAGLIFWTFFSNAVGMASKIPPHNIGEIVEAAIALIQDPSTPLSKIAETVQGPDFPTGGLILGRQGIHDYFRTGRGTLKVRAKAATEKLGRDREAIIVTELPYQVNKARLIEATAALINDKKLEGLDEPRDESDREGMRIVFPLKRGEQAEVVLNNLYKHTQLQVNFGVILLAIVNGQPRELPLIEAIKRFIDHRVDVVRRRTDYLLRKAQEREHILLGFKKALDNLDAVIALIRAAKTPKDARDGLMTRFEFTEKQAQAIIELQLQRLTGMEQQKILEELTEIQKKIAEYVEILGSEKVLRNLIVKELKEVQKEYGDERRTQIIEDTGEIKLEDLVRMEDVAVTVTRGGYLKRTPCDTYRRQSRGGPASMRPRR